MTPEYTIVRSNRKTLSLEIRPDLAVVVRAPRRCSQRDIDAFVSSRRDWLETYLEKQRRRLLEHPEPSEERRSELIAMAKARLPAKVEHYGRLMGLSPTSIRITGAKTRFGSCGPKNNLCFSWRLMEYPDAAVDYVVVHELAHIVHKNHGPAFYSLVASILPDHKARRALLGK